MDATADDAVDGGHLDGYGGGADTGTGTGTGTGMEPGEEPLDLPEPPVTGDAAVDDAVARLAAMMTQPLETQVTAFDGVHRALQDRLADVEG